MGCDDVEVSPTSMAKEMERFSRTFNKKHYDNAVKVYDNLKRDGYKGNFPKVSTWELYDKAFTWPRIRRYEHVNEGMNTLEHFEDNLNSNLSNGKHINSFIKHAKDVQ